MVFQRRIRVFRLYKFFLPISFLLIFATTGFSESQFTILENQQENELQLITESSDTIHVSYTCNYIPGWQKLYVRFNNGSLLGYFPMKDKALTIRAWNDKKYPFELFFCNAHTGKISILEKESGWNFHFFSSDTEDSKWVAVVPQGKAKLFLIDSSGNILQQIFFDAEFSPDVVRIEKRDKRSILIIESLDYYCEYFIDFKHKLATKMK